MTHNLDASLDELVATYNISLETMMDKYAPRVKKMITPRPNTQWYNNDARLARQTKS